MGLKSDQTSYHIYLPESKRIIITRSQYFHICKSQQLPGVASLLDGISRQSELEAPNGEPNGNAEDIIPQAFHAYRFSLFRLLPTAGFTKGNLKDHRLPRSFKEALCSKDWCATIGREYSALRQTPGIDFNPDGLYAPVASHESIRILFSITASDGLLVEGADICCAYLYGELNVPVYMEQTTNSSGLQEMPGCFCPLIRSMYGLKQAGIICCSLFTSKLISWGFIQSKIDPRFLFSLNNEKG